jgi:hypothetical protein
MGLVKTREVLVHELYVSRSAGATIHWHHGPTVSCSFRSARPRSGRICFSTIDHRACGLTADIRKTLADYYEYIREIRCSMLA